MLLFHVKIKYMRSAGRDEKRQAGGEKLEPYFSFYLNACVYLSWSAPG